MKNCKECTEFSCGYSGTDRFSAHCGFINKMHTYATGAIREDKTGKGRCDLLPMCALIRLSKHYEAGSAEHGERNWEKGIPMHSFLDSAIRHLFEYVDGRTDEDHLCAAAWNILGAMWTEEKHPEMQDIPSRKLSEVSSLLSDTRGILEPVPDKENQEKATLEPRKTCKCWDNSMPPARCNGIQERDVCKCEGDERNCDFYPDKRVKALLQ